MGWACSPDNIYADVSVACEARQTTECCFADPTTCSSYDIINDGDLVYDSYYSKINKQGTGPDNGSCNFNQAAYIISNCEIKQGTALNRN